MNALLDIQIRIQAQQALAQLRAVQGQINQLNQGITPGAAAATGGLGKLGAMVDKVSGKMISWGKNMQWTGQQLTMSFTLPLMLLGGLATKWALENEAAFTRVRKVYAGAPEDLDKLRLSFELLSSRFGVNQAEVIGIGEAWAAVGAQGTQLAKSVENTMKFMILSGLDAQQATEGLIVTQTAYKLSTQELTQAIADMNAIENVTALKMKDLLVGLQNAGGGAELVGIDIRHLSAYMAALVPVTGTAAKAGTALKTIFSRIFAPTPEAEEMLSIIGVTNTELAKMQWHAANGEERIQLLADATGNLTDEQISVMASVLGGRRQYEQLVRLLDDVRSGTGNYATALDATSDAQKSNASAAKELSIFLSSQPQGFKIMMTTLQNMLAKAVMPLLPALASLLAKIVSLVKWFTDLDPSTQAWIFTLLAALAALGPIIRYVGAFGQLLGVLAKFAGHAGSVLMWMFKNVILNVAKVVASVAWMVVNMIAGFTVMVAKGAWWVAQQALQLAAWVGRTALATAQVVASHAKAIAIQLAQQAKLWAGYAIGTARALGWMAGQWIAHAARVLTITVAMYVRLAAIWAAGVAKQALTVAAQVATWVAGQVAMAAASVAAAAASAAAWLAANPYVLLIIVAIAAVVAAVAALIVFWDSDFVMGIRNGVMAVIDWIGKIPEFFGGIIEWFENAIRTIVEGIYNLPKAFGEALMAILHFVQKVISKIIDWLSYLNPFARHSPSLVDNVTAGVTEILKQYSRLGRIGSMLSGVQAAHENFAAVADPTVGNATQRKFAGQRDAIAKGAPSVLPAFDNHVALITRLMAELPALEAAIARQEAVVKEWADALEDANEAVAAAEKVLKRYKDELQAIEDQIDKAQSAISDLANTGITGMRKMEDAIFDNEIAQKKLRLEILRLGKAYGGIDKLKDKFAELQGQIEKMRSEREELRQAGAGSEILAEYDAQIESLKKQQDEISKAGDQISDLERQLEALQLAAEEMELEKAITFDPQLRQIEQLANGLNELPFDEIIKQIKAQQAQVKLLEAAQVAANQKVVEQTAEVDRLTAARDVLQEGYDREKATLDDIKEVYDAVRDAISLLEGDLQGFSTALDEVNDKASELQRLMDEATGDFEEFKNINPEDLGSLDEFNAELQRQLDEALANMEDFDLWAPIREQWENFKAWISEQWRIFCLGWNFIMMILRQAWDGMIQYLKDMWSNAMNALSYGWSLFTAPVRFGIDAIKNAWAALSWGLSAVWNGALDMAKMAWDRFTAPIRLGIDTIKNLWAGMVWGMGAAWNGIWSAAETQFGNFKRGLESIWTGIQNVFKTGANFVIGAIESILNAAIRMVNNMSAPLSALSRLVGGNEQSLQFPEVRLQRLAQGGITNGPALIGEGRGMYPEYVIPTDPMFFNQAKSLYDMLGKELGITPDMATAGAGVGGGYAASIPSAAVTATGGDTIINIDTLELPNIKSGGDAKEFLDNLKSLGND